MKYKVRYCRSLGKWLVYNSETKQDHSRWETSIEASNSAKDLNKQIKNEQFLKCLVELNSSEIILQSK